jgi:hypothetical protein
MILFEVVLSLQNVASGVIADVIRRQPPSAGRTAFAWTLTVGPAMAKATTVELSDGILVVTARDARWAREVTRARDTIVARLRMLLGSKAIDEVRVHASKEGL